MDFDDVYRHLISPAVVSAGLQPHRADEETLGGVFQKTMFERLALCEYAIADLSFANPNVFYELGVRHALRPWSTVLLFREGSPLPLDVAETAALPYSASTMKDAGALAKLQHSLTRRLLDARGRTTDSPVHQLVAGLAVPEVDHRRVDMMLEAIERESRTAKDIAQAARRGIQGISEVQNGLGDLSKIESETVVALLMAYRSANAWDQMLHVASRMTPELREVWLVREQEALALARLGRFEEAAEICQQLIRRRPNAESYGLLGGTFKRHWRSVRDQNRILARALLERAADAYCKGFDIDMRDPYPGVNAVALLRIAGRTEEADALAPVVEFCVKRRLAHPEPEYWDHACAVELALLKQDTSTVSRELPFLIVDMVEPFQAVTFLEGLTDLERVPAMAQAGELLRMVSDEVSDRLRTLEDMEL